MEFINLKRCMDNFLEEYNVPGVDCAVYKNHDLLFRYYTGKSDLENNKLMNGNELFSIFSMTKMLTCVSALQLFEKGKFKLEDPVSDYLPEFKKMRIASEQYTNNNSADIATGKTLGEEATVNGECYAVNPITIKHLFTMTAGLDYNVKAEGIKKALSNNKTSTRDIVRAMSETVLGFEPGTRYRYSLCHDVLGALIEVLSGQRLGEYMKENIFIPLGMNNTFFGVPKDEDRLSKMAARYTYDDKKNLKRLPLQHDFNISEDYESGGAGLTSSTMDYAVFLDAMANGGVGKNGNRILSESSVKLMKTCQIEGKPLEDFLKMRPGYGYGLGVRTKIGKDDSLSPIGEFGWDGAGGAFALVDTENKLSLTYFQQVHNWNIKIQTEMKNALYSDFLSL
ncbi:MAG: beta-lactamase family protein [Clostridia bacterium]|nr:beta-lactamase family protein [Clostridia bacterium]